MTPDRVKYPRTFHLSWSLGATDDDKTHSDADILVMFGGKEVVVTEKLDGENTTIYADGYCHARSMDSAHHVSRGWVKALAARVALDLPTGWRVCGENLFAKHSIGYEALPSYFMVFGIYDENNNALSWDDLVEWCELLGLSTVPVLYRGVWDEKAVRALYPSASKFGAEAEGYVVRIAEGYAYEDFVSSMAKFVRANHVRTEGHWMHSSVVPNVLVSE